MNVKTILFSVMCLGAFGLTNLAVPAHQRAVIRMADPIIIPPQHTVQPANAA